MPAYGLNGHTVSFFGCILTSVAFESACCWPFSLPGPSSASFSTERSLQGFGPRSTLPPALSAFQLKPQWTPPRTHNSCILNSTICPHELYCSPHEHWWEGPQSPFLLKTERGEPRQLRVASFRAFFETSPYQNSGPGMGAATSKILRCPQIASLLSWYKTTRSFCPCQSP